MSEDGPSPSTARVISPLAVDVMRHSEAWENSSVSDESIVRAAQAAFAEVRPEISQACEVVVVLTDDAEMQDLNRTWRRKDKPTNVLSFPANEVPGDTAALGDIVIAYETVRAEAIETHIPLSNHVSHLVVHGILHVLGFDHLEEQQAEEMEDLERKVLAGLGIADPYQDAHEKPLAETLQ